MIALWVIVGLILSAISVSTLGAAFSIFGLSQLFSGAALAVILMAAALEFSKFVLAAFLHQTWKRQNAVFKYYLASAVVILSVITSLGIFGFLSNAYQSASSVLDSENVKLASLQNQLSANGQEVARLNHAIDEIPANRVTKKIQARADTAPTFAKLSQEAANIQASITQSNLKLIEVKQKVGPLIYIARAFQVDIDQVVKYLILVFVLVFDPLAICLVIASSQALEMRRNRVILSEAKDLAAAAPPPPAPNQQVVKMRFVDGEAEPKKASS